MAPFTAPSRRCLLVGTALLSTGLLAGLLGGPPRPAQAISGCLSDPIVWLSNGAMVDLRSIIVDSSTDVQNVAYSLHAPAGTSVVKVVYTGGQLAGKESFQFYADNAPNTYDGQTVATTGTPGAAMIAGMRLTDSGHAAAITFGSSGQTLALHLITTTFPDEGSGVR